MRPGRDSLDAILKRCGIQLSPDQLGLLWRYHGLLRAANAELNLTRIHNFENMVLKHYVDSLLILNFVDLPSPLIDMGSGPGLPGIPLKIARPETRMILAEPRGARADFLASVIAELGLTDIEVYAHKLGSSYPGTVGGVISRAVGPISETLDRVAGCLDEGGKMMLMKGPDCDDELEAADRGQAMRFRLLADHKYEIPGTSHRRRLIVYERLSQAEADPFRPARGAPAFQGHMREITSEANPTVKHLRELLHGRGIRKHGQAILTGSRIISEVLERFPDRAQGWITGSQGPPPDADLTWYRLAGPLFRELDVAGTRSPLLLVSVPELERWSSELPWPDGCTLFVPFQDPENVGAVIRSAAAFGVSRVVLLAEAAHPFHPRSGRAAGTALFQVPLVHGPPIRELTSGSVPLIGLDSRGEELGEATFPDRFGLVLGLEGPGLSAEVAVSERRRIVIAPGVDSLNAAAAAAVALFAWSSRRRST